jgi:hypothetical protein
MSAANLARPCNSTRPSLSRHCPIIVGRIAAEFRRKRLDYDGPCNSTRQSSASRKCERQAECILQCAIVEFPYSFGVWTSEAPVMSTGEDTMRACTSFGITLLLAFTTGFPLASSAQLIPQTFQNQQTVDVSSLRVTPEGNLRFGIAGATQGRFSNELVNVSQLQGGLAYEDFHLRTRINDVQHGANQGVAAAAAMLTTIRTPDPGKSTISVGGGYYGGQAASAVSLAHRSRSGKLQAVAALGIPTSMVTGANIAASGAIGWQF